MAQWIRDFKPHPSREGPPREVREALANLPEVPKDGNAPRPPPAKLRAIAKARLAQLKALRERNRLLAATNDDSVGEKFVQWRDDTLQELMGAGEVLKLELAKLKGDALDPESVQRAIQICEKHLRKEAYPWFPVLADFFIAPAPAK